MTLTIADLRKRNFTKLHDFAPDEIRYLLNLAADLKGAHVTHLGPEGSQIGHKESMKDTAQDRTVRSPRCAL
ncbi:MAG: hypothetical protein HGA45_26225 [Chloroflexales bacterium]|nr:hypothetical protein [Chloroflexales bacterium]